MFSDTVLLVIILEWQGAVITTMIACLAFSSTLYSPELIFKSVNIRSTEIFLTEENVVFIWVEVSPVSLDFAHGNEVVHSWRQRTRVDEQRASVVLSPVNSQ